MNDKKTTSLSSSVIRSEREDPGMNDKKTISSSSSVIRSEREDPVMNDKKTTIEDLKKIYKQFVDEREWNQFHTPKNLAMDVSVEASELMELFLWCNNDQSFKVAENKKQDVQDEAADVLMALLCFCNATGIDLAQAVQQKMEQNRKKYPIEKCKGVSTKYLDL